MLKKKNLVNMKELCEDSDEERTLEKAIKGKNRVALCEPTPGRGPALAKKWMRPSWLRTGLNHHSLAPPQRTEVCTTLKAYTWITPTQDQTSEVGTWTKMKTYVYLLCIYIYDVYVRKLYKHTYVYIFIS